MATRPSVRVHTWRGEAAVTLAAGDLAATFLPDLGMLGVSLRHRGEELLALPHSLAAYRRGVTTGLGLLHPWANRLGTRRYRAAGRTVDLTRVDLPTDPHGLPIHGTCHARAFDLVEARAGRVAAVLRARLDFAARPDLLASFPYPHELEVAARLGPAALRVTTIVTPTGRGPVPVSFGWHPYLRLPGLPRHDWVLRIPACRRQVLDRLLLPTGRTVPQPADRSPVGRRTYDDHFRLGADRRFALEGGGRRVTIRFGSGYGHAQVYLPPRRGFACLEPMTAPVNALVRGDAPLARPGAPCSATFEVSVTARP